MATRVPEASQRNLEPGLRSRPSRISFGTVVRPFLLMVEKGMELSFAIVQREAGPNHEVPSASGCAQLRARRVDGGSGSGRRRRAIALAMNVRNRLDHQPELLHEFALQRLG